MSYLENFYFVWLSLYPDDLFPFLTIFSPTPYNIAFIFGLILTLITQTLKDWSVMQEPTVSGQWQVECDECPSLLPPPYLEGSPLSNSAAVTLPPQWWLSPYIIDISKYISEYLLNSGDTQGRHLSSVPTGHCTQGDTHPQGRRLSTGHCTPRPPPPPSILGDIISVIHGSTTDLAAGGHWQVSAHHPAYTNWLVLAVCSRGIIWSKESDSSLFKLIYCSPCHWRSLMTIAGAAQILYFNYTNLSQGKRQSRNYTITLPPLVTPVFLVSNKIDSHIMGLYWSTWCISVLLQIADLLLARTPPKGWSGISKWTHRCSSISQCTEVLK